MCNPATRPDPLTANVTWHVQLNYTHLGSKFQNNQYFKSTGTFFPADAIALGDAAIDAWKNNVRSITGKDVYLDNVVVTDISSATGTQIVDTTGLPSVGTAADPALPGNVTAALSFRTALRGRSFRGRNYLVGITDAQRVGDSLPSTAITAFLVAWNAYFADIITALPTLAHSVVSWCQDGAWVNPGTVTAVTNLQLEGTLDSQRRRLSGRGA